MIAPRFLLCLITALAMHTWPAHADALSEAFTRFAVRQAPTFVLTLNDAANDMQGNCRAGCATPASFVSVAGDVSLDYALETIQRRQPQAAPRAEPLLKRLRASPTS